MQAGQLLGLHYFIVYSSSPLIDLLQDIVLLKEVMMKKIIVSFLVLTPPVFTSSINLPKLQAEFNTVGIYNPASPSDYNEQRATEILKCLESNRHYRPLAQRLRSEQQTSLANIAASSSPSALILLQQENEQLRKHAQHLQEKLGALQTTSRAQSSAPFTRSRPDTDHTKQIISDLITNVNDLTLETTQSIQSLANELNRSAAQEGLERIRSRIQGIHELQTQLTQTHATP